MRVLFYHLILLLQFSNALLNPCSYWRKPTLGAEIFKSYYEITVTGNSDIGLQVHRDRKWGCYHADNRSQFEDVGNFFYVLVCITISLIFSLDDKEDSKSVAVVAELENIDDECDQKVKSTEYFAIDS